MTRKIIMQKYNKTELIEKLKSFLRAEECVGNDDSFKFTVNFYPKGRTVYLLKNDFESAFEKLNTLTQSKIGGLISSNYFEIYVRAENSFYIREDLPIHISDLENELSYEIDKPSICYILYIISDLNNIKNLRRFASHPFRDDEQLSEINLRDFFYETYRSEKRIHTVTIQSEKKVTESKFESLLKSFIFQLSYNLGYVFVTPISFENPLIHNGIYSSLRSDINNMEPPKRIYVNELINFYQQGLVAESLYLKYLSFYHIIEYFFDRVLFSNLENQVQNKLTNPGFSYKSEKDLRSLIKPITSTVKYQQEEYSFDEKTSLKLVLEKYVEIESLVKQLNDYDNTIIQFYKDNKVNFSKGDCVDLTLVDKNQIFKKLAERIYKTRCSLVHSKGFSEQKFIPFENELTNEIPLIKKIAEQVIINSSEIIK